MENSNTLMPEINQASNMFLGICIVLFVSISVYNF